MQFTLGINLDGVLGPKAVLSHALHALASRLVNFNEGMAGEMAGYVADADGKAIGKWEIGESKGKMLCVHCGHGIRKATDADKAILSDEGRAKTQYLHDSNVWFCSPSSPHRAEPDPQAGRILTDFAGTSKVFKRPKHGVSYCFPRQGGGHLTEIMPDGRTFLPRLTAEDLTATDWEEVTE